MFASIVRIVTVVGLELLLRDSLIFLDLVLKDVRPRGTFLAFPASTISYISQGPRMFVARVGLRIELEAPFHFQSNMSC